MELVVADPSEAEPVIAKHEQEKAKVDKEKTQNDKQQARDDKEKAKKDKQQEERGKKTGRGRGRDERDGAIQCESCRQRRASGVERSHGRTVGTRMPRPRALSCCARLRRPRPGRSQGAAAAGTGRRRHHGVARARLPLELPFVDSDGGKTTLGQFFDGVHPVILTMNYSDCPMLCSVQLNGLVDAMRAMPWNLGEQFHVVTVSIDPLETPAASALTKQKYLKLYNRPGRRRRLAFPYRPGGGHQEAGRDGGISLQIHPRNRRQFAHAAALILCTPDGACRGTWAACVYNPQTLRLSLVEASEGKVGSVIDQFFLSCFHYDEKAGRYGLFALGIMVASAAALTVLVLGGARLLLGSREPAGRPQTQGGGIADDVAVPPAASCSTRSARHCLRRASESFWLPPPGSTASAIVDNLFYILLGVSIFFFTLIVVLMTLFVIVYPPPRRRGAVAVAQPQHGRWKSDLDGGFRSSSSASFSTRAFTGFMELRTAPAKPTKSASSPGNGCGCSSIPTGTRTSNCTCRWTSRCGWSCGPTT